MSGLTFFFWSLPTLGLQIKNLQYYLLFVEIQTLCYVAKQEQRQCIVEVVWVRHLFLKANETSN